MNTVKVKTDELLDRALDYAVALCQGGTSFHYDTVGTYWITINGKDRALSRGWSKSQSFTPSTDWVYGGPIIYQEGISVIRCCDDYVEDDQGFTTSERIPVWAAVLDRHELSESYGPQGDCYGPSYQIDSDAITGPTPLIAAMRCYVAFKLGSAVEVPAGLLR